MDLIDLGRLTCEVRYFPAKWPTHDETSLEKKHDTLCDLGNMTINWDTFVIHEASTNAPYGWKNNQLREIKLNNKKNVS
jgi:hypothetical protein